MTTTLPKRLALSALLLTVVAAFSTADAPAPDPIPMLNAEIFGLDGAHSHLGFSIGFMGLNKVRGTFDSYDMAILNNEEDITKVSVTLMIEVESINTSHAGRDRDLRSERFFHAEAHPYIIFQSERVEAQGDGYVMHGPLTMRGITRPIAIPFTKTVNRMEDPAWGNIRIGFEGSLTLNRKDYDILGNNFWGNTVLADEVTIEFSVLGGRSNYARRNFNSRSKPSVGDTLMHTLADRGLDAALALYDNLDANTYNNSPGELDLVGRKLLQQGQLDAALAFFDLAVAGAPNVAPFHTILGEALALKGDREAATRHFERAFALEPDDPTAIEVLRRLGHSLDAAAITQALADKASASAAQTVTVPTEVLAQYVGNYELQPGFVIAVTLDGDHLVAQATGQNPAVLNPLSETRFALEGSPIELAFNRTDAGAVESLTVFQGGQEMPAKKIE